jgi:hypothetical protein
LYKFYYGLIYYGENEVLGSRVISDGAGLTGVTGACTVTFIGIEVV